MVRLDTLDIDSETEKNKMAKTVMVCGIGEVGGWALELLARSEDVDRIVTSDRNGGRNISSEKHNAS